MALARAVEESVEKDSAKAVIMGSGPLSASALRLQSQFDVPLVVAVNAVEWLLGIALILNSKNITPFNSEGYSFSGLFTIHRLANY